MKFTGPDLMVSKFQVDVIVVSQNVLHLGVLERAADRLLSAWPMHLVSDPSIGVFEIQDCHTLQGLYNAVNAFFEGLRGETTVRPAAVDRTYKVASVTSTEIKGSRG